MGLGFPDPARETHSARRSELRQIFLITPDGQEELNLIVVLLLEIFSYFFFHI